MKKNFAKSKIILLIVVLLLLVCTGAGLAWNFLRPTDQKVEKPIGEKTETEVIFSFESYGDITGTSIRVGNQFGATQINKDREYITDGEASWMVKPQGSYYTKETYPYFQMSCSNSTFKTADFNDYDKVMLDIYNASDEEIQIKWNFKVLNILEETVDTEEVIYTLAPNVWTTCEYDLTNETYGKSLRLHKVRYMTVTFLTQKESMNDTVPTLYLDNLCGHLSDTERVITEMEFDFDKGLTFEDEIEQYLFVGDTTVNNKMSLSRVDYADTTIGVQKEIFGEYALMGDATGAVWPAFTVNFAKSYNKGMILSFMMYVEADEAKVSGKTYKVESYTQKGDTQNGVLTKSYSFNRWVQVNIALNAESEKSWIFANFDDGMHRSMLEDSTVRIYMDNFYMYENTEALRLSNAVVNEDGSVVISNPTGGSTVYHTFEISAKKGQVVSFDLDVTPAQSISVWVLGDDMWEDEYYAQYYGSWKGKTTIEAEIPEDTGNVTIFVKFMDEALDFTDNLTSISNVKVGKSKKPENYDFSQGITFEDPAEQYLFQGNSNANNKLELSHATYKDTTVNPLNNSFGEAFLMGEATGAIWPEFTAEFEKSYAKGNVLSFMLYVEVDEKVANGKTYKVDSYDKKRGTRNEMLIGSCDFNRWVQVNVTLSVDSETIYHFINLDDGTGKSILGSETVKVYMDNFRIYEDKEALRLSNTTVHADNSVTITNPSGGNTVYHTFAFSAKKEQVVSFDLDVTPAQSLSVWVLGTDMWEDEYYAQYYGTWTGKTTIEAEMPENTEKVTIFVKFMDEAFDFSSNVTNISNVKVEKSKKPENYSFGQGITFEDSAEQYLFQGNSNVNNKLELSHATYKDTTVNPLNNSFGEAFLMGEATGAIWPEFTAEFEKSYAKGNVLSFMLYVEVDEKVANGKTYKVDSYDKKRGTRNEMLIGSCDFNRWVQVNVTLSVDSETIYHFINLDDGTGKSILGSETVKVYMDNFRIYEDKEALRLSNIVVNDDDSITISNPSGGNTIYHTLSQPVKNGQIVSVDLDITPAQSVSVWLLGDGMWDDEYFAKYYATWTGETTIQVAIPEETENITVFVQFKDSKMDFQQSVVTISDVKIISSVSATITNPAGSKTRSYTFSVAAKKGQTVVFEIDVAPAQSMSVWLLGDDMWKDEYYAKYYATWDGKTVIEVELPADTANITIFVEFKNTSVNYSGNVVNITELKFKNKVIGGNE